MCRPTRAGRGPSVGVVRAVVVVVALVVAGCSIHAGPTIAWRSRGAVAVGWHAGAGIDYLDAMAEGVGGQSFVRGGGAFSYGGLGLGAHGATQAGPGGASSLGLGQVVIGGGRGDRGGGLVLAGEGGMLVGRDVEDGFDDDVIVGGEVLVGVRLLGSEVELYATVQAALLSIYGDAE